VIGYGQLLKVFFENHDPTSGMRQGNDVGTQYRSGIYTTSAARLAEATEVKAAFGRVLSAKGFGPITTEVQPAGEFYFAEAYHQQYLAKNPGGYCGLGGTGATCPVGVGAAAG
jgi:peptide-methionine (S)-S-oxide reductase